MLAQNEPTMKFWSKILFVNHCALTVQQAITVINRVRPGVAQNYGPGGDRI